MRHYNLQNYLKKSVDFKTYIINLMLCVFMHRKTTWVCTKTIEEARGGYIGECRPGTTHFHFFNFFSFDDVKRQTMLQRKSCIADITFGKKSPISSTLFITNNGVSSITFELSCGGNNVATISHIWKMSFLSIPM